MFNWLHTTYWSENRNTIKGILLHFTIVSRQLKCKSKLPFI